MNAITFAYPAICYEHILSCYSHSNLCACKIGYADAQRLHNGFT